MGSCRSVCKAYGLIGKDRTIILPEDYIGCGIPNPPILPVSIVRVIISSLTRRYAMTVGTPTNSFDCSVEASGDPPIFLFIDKPRGVSIEAGILTFGGEFAIAITLSSDVALAPGTFVPGDKYTIYPEPVECIIDSAVAVFERPTSGSVSSNLEALPLTLISARNSSTLPIDEPNCKQCDSIRIPQINITAQTTIDGSDINDAIFTILDEFDYDRTSRSVLHSTTHNNIIQENTCAIRYIKRNDVEETVFRQCCPYMVSVIRGKGKTFYDRVLSIYNKLGEAKIGVNFITFYRYLVLYGMAKYILSKLLYGDFNIDYLLGKYNEKFLADLGESRFCGFIEFFEDCESPVRGYNKYFKY